MKMPALSRNTFLLFTFICGQQYCLTSFLESYNPTSDDLSKEKTIHSGGRIIPEELPAKCNICAFAGSTLRGDFIPTATKAAARLSLKRNGSLQLNPLEDIDVTCAQWNDIITVDDSTEDCLDLRDWLSWQCCEGMPFLYECETMVEKSLLLNDAAHYKRSRAPVAGRNPLDVSMSLHVSMVSIVNHGVDGGALEVTGSLHLHWVDERLKWNSSEAGCFSVSVLDSEIWVPKLVQENQNESTTDTALEKSDIDVMADGRVFWTRNIRVQAYCKTVPQSVSRVCTIGAVDKKDVGKVRYVEDSERKAISVADNVDLQEYVLDENQTVVSVKSTLTPYTTEQTVQFTFFFRSLDKMCQICDHTATLNNGTIHSQDVRWKEKFPNTEHFSCFDIYNLLQNSTMDSEVCSLGRANFEEACCDDSSTLMSSYICESNLHTHLTSRDYNTITPPDPSANENDESFMSKDEVDVGISLDVTQMVEIDLKSHTLKMLVDLELSWFDQRLAWDPFIGGCHRVTFRASNDAELTEIWVPNIDLSNIVEGVQSMPESHASVFFDGSVVWRRRGVLTATCEFEGITKFPHDTLSCFLEFGEDRDPLYHRVNYYDKTQEVQFHSSQTTGSFNYQEYNLLANKTTVTTRKEHLSGFENKLIRYVFYFKRAHKFYERIFVIMYILFTYLSFGTFLIDLTAGERISYGISIVFVMVAQDIVLADSTPATQEFLWIYKLSLVSKVFIIFSVAQTLLAQWWLNKIFEEESACASVRSEHNGEESRNSPLPAISESIITHSGTENDNDELFNENDGVLGSNGKGKNKPLKKHLRKGLVRAINKFASFGNKFAHLKITETDSRKTKRTKKLKMLDMACAVVSVSLYSLFVIILYTVYK